MAKELERKESKYEVTMMRIVFEIDALADYTDGRMPDKYSCMG